MFWRILCLIGLATGLLWADLPLAQEFGEELVAARHQGDPLPQISRAHPDASLEDAYDAQKVLVSAILDEPDKIAGFKGGAVSEASQTGMGITEPLSAVLFESGKLQAGEGPISIKFDRVPAVGIETEIGFLLAKGVVEPLTSPEQAKALVAAVLPVVELPAGEFQKDGKITAGDLAAMNVMSKLYIMGTMFDPTTVDPDAVKVRLYSGDQLVHETTGAEAKNGQYWNLMQQINHALEQGYEVVPGQLIITGALGTIHRQAPGEFRAEWEGWGEIEFSIE